MLQRSTLKSLKIKLVIKGDPMKLSVILAAAFVFSSGVVFAEHHENCKMADGKMVHADNADACKKMGGTYSEPAKDEGKKEEKKTH